LPFNPYFSIAKRLMRLRKQPIIVKRLGARWELHPSDWIDNRLVIGRPFERQQLAFCERLIKQQDCTIFFDIGANIGLYSVILGLRSPSLTQIHSFEPIETTYKRLVKNLNLNEFSAQVNPYHYALSDKTAERPILFSQSSSGTSTLHSTMKEMEKSDPRRKFNTEQQIQTKTLDTEFSLSGERLFFKIDIEGHESAALTGMTNTLKNNNCILQIELWEQHHEAVKQQLANLDYGVFHQIDHDFYFQRNLNS